VTTPIVEVQRIGIYPVAFPDNVGLISSSSEEDMSAYP